MEFKTELKEYQNIVEKELEKYIRKQICPEQMLNESMEYSLMADAVLFVWDGRTQGIDKTLLYAKRKNKPYAFIIV